MRRLAPRAIGSVVDRVLERVSPDTPLADVQRAWGDAVGPAIAAEAQPVADRRGTLVIECGSATWAAELDLMQDELKARLEAATGRRLGPMKFVASATSGSSPRQVR